MGGDTERSKRHESEGQRDVERDEALDERKGVAHDRGTAVAAHGDRYRGRLREGRKPVSVRSPTVTLGPQNEGAGSEGFEPPTRGLGNWCSISVVSGRLRVSGPVLFLGDPAGQPPFDMYRTGPQVCRAALILFLLVLDPFHGDTDASCRSITPLFGNAEVL